MRKYYDFKTKYKIIVGIIPLNFLTILLLIYALTNMWNLFATGRDRYNTFGEGSKEIAVMYANYQQSLALLGEASEIAGAGTNVDQAALEEKLSEIEQCQSKNSELKDAFGTLSFKNGEIIDLRDSFFAELDKYNTVSASVLNLFRSSSYSEGVQTLKSEEAQSIESAVKEQFEALSERMNDVVSEELTSGKGRFKFHLILFGVLGLFLMLGYGQMIIMISNFTDRQFKALNEMAERIAEGDVDVECKQVYKDDFGDLIGKFKIMVDNIKHQAEVAARMTEGDLTVDITPNSDRDALGNSLKKLLKQDNYVLSNINESANQVFVGADQVASASQSLAQGSTEQASAIEQVSASIVDIAEKTRVNASDAGTASELVNSAKGQAVSGSKQMNEMMEAMEDINRSSENIYKIIKVIDDIAFQTNILALNAAVEAARAGSHGKGFAVVADEVRNLAGKSATAASETAELIEDSIAKISNGSKLAAETKDALEQIVKSVEDIVTIVDRIAIASNEQATAIAQVDQAVSQVSQVVQTNSATSEQCAAASEELSAQAENLRMLIGRFKLKKQYGGGFEEELTIDLGDEPDEPIYAIEQNTFEYSGDTGKY